MTKLYGYSASTGAHTGEVIERERGVPPGFTFIKPPEYDSNTQLLVFTGDAWGILDKVEAATDSNTAMTIKPRQLREWLIVHGVMPEQVSAEIATIEDAVERALMQNYWEYSSEFYRDHPRMVAFAVKMGVTDLPKAFQEASQL